MERRDFLAASLTLAGALATRSTHGQPTPSTRAAVVIGVDTAGDFPTLRAARSGARSVAAWLTAEGFDVALLVDDPNPVTANGVKAAVKAFVERPTLDQLVVYFAGHGFVNNSSAELWLLSGAPDDPNEAVSLTESRALARLSGIPNVVFISDACRSLADSVRTANVRGQIVFPNKGTRTNVNPDVDQFLATRIGDPAWEVGVRESKTDTESIYTACFLEAFKTPYASMVEMVDGKPVIPNRRLRHYLEQEVPKRAQAARKTLSQQPDAEICSDEPTYIGHVSTAQRTAGDGGGPNLSDVVSTAVGAPIGGGTPQHADTVTELATRSGFAVARDTIVQARGLPAKLSARSGFAVSGQRVVAVTAKPEIKAEFVSSPDTAAPSALVELDLKGMRAASVALRFADGSGTVIAALDEYVGNIVVDDGRVTNVSYVPSKQSPMRSAYEYEAKRLDELHATVATAARFGVFRIEGPKAARNSTAAQMADRIRLLKGIDPTLGLYAAYAYADAGLMEQVRSVRGYMRGDLGVDLFDVAMLSGDLSGKPPGDPRGPYPFCPMLSQGWALLRVKDVRLQEDVVPVRDHLRPGLWTTLDREGMTIAEKALRDARVA
jgi:hypothetical protein